MASSDSQIDKPQPGHPKRAELPDVNINTGAQSNNTERALRWVSLSYVLQQIRAREGTARVHERGLHVCTRGDCTCARHLESLHTLTSQCGIKYESFSPKAVHTIWKKFTQLESASFMRRWRLTLSESFCLFNVSMIALASSRPCIKDNTFWFWEWR